MQPSLLCVLNLPLPPLTRIHVIALGLPDNPALRQSRITTMPTTPAHRHLKILNLITSASQPFCPYLFLAVVRKRLQIAGLGYRYLFRGFFFSL